jgi:hypothetical protein
VTTNIDKFFKEQGLLPIGTLAHYGIKGQRWGFRRSDAQLAKSASKTLDAADAVRAATTQAAINKAKSTSVVSDADLNHLVNRLNLEKRYVDIKASTSTSTKTHSKIKTLLSVGDTLNKAVSFSQSPAGQMLASKLGLAKVATGKHTAAAVAAAKKATNK